MRNQIKSLALILAIAAPLAAHASDPDFYFAAVGDTTGNAISSLTIGGVGSTFSFSVWLKTNVTFSSGDAFVAFDRSDTTGTGATPLDGLFTANIATAITNLTSTETMPFGVALAGGYSSSGASTVPYGIDATFVPAGALGATASAPSGVHLFDVTLTNAGLSSGSSSLVTLWDGGIGQGDGDFSSFVMDANGGIDAPGSSPVLRVTTAVPEPFSMSLLGLALVPLIRRRK